MIPNQLLIICMGKHLPTNPIVVYVSWSILERGAVPMKRHKEAIQKKMLRSQLAILIIVLYKLYMIYSEYLK